MKCNMCLNVLLKKGNITAKNCIDLCSVFGNVPKRVASVRGLPLSNDGKSIVPGLGNYVLHV